MSNEVKTHLSAEDILAIDDSKTSVVEIPEWNTLIKLRQLNGEESEAIENFVLSKKAADGAPKNLSGFRALVISKVAVKEDGVTPLFTPSQVRDLMKKNVAPLNKLFEAACQLNGLAEAAQKELEKN